MRRGSRRSGTTRSAYERALGLLARREYSRRDLRMRLLRAGHESSEVDDALSRLEADHYQDDDRFAEMLVRNRARQGYGPRRIQAELKSHGLADAAIRELLDAEGTDWAVSAREQLRRRYGAGAPAAFAERAKRAQYLLRRGFAAATVRAVTHAEVDDADAI